MPGVGWIDNRISAVDGTRDRELQQQKLDIAHELAEHQRDRELKRQGKAFAYRDDAARQGVLPTVAALTPHEKRNYSVTRLVQSLSRGTDENSLEMDISTSLAKDVGGAAHGGVLIPFMGLGLDTKTGAAGAYTTSDRVGDILDGLREGSALFRLGVNFLSSIKYQTRFPVEDAQMSAQWLTENSGTDVTQSDPSLRAVTMKPHQLQATTSFSYELFQSSSPNLEAWLRSRIGKSHGVALDAAAITGTGGSDPTGMLNRGGIPVIAIGANGGPPTADAIRSLEDTVSTALAVPGGFLTNSKIRKELRATESITGNGLPVWTDQNTMLGYRAEVSQHVPSNLAKGTSNDCSAIILGDWRQFLVAEFTGVVELLVDRLSKKKQRMIELTSYATYDCSVQNDGAFAMIVDAT